MTVLTFPSNPIVGQVYNAPNGLRYVYDGIKWVVETVTSTSEAVTNSTQDRVAPMFVNGDNTGITFSYNAATNTMSAEVTAVNGNSLVNGIHEVVLGANGTLTVADDIILPAAGRIVKDCGNAGGTTSMRWVNIPTIDDEQEVQLIRVYTGDPDALGNLDRERGTISVEWQAAEKSGVSISSFNRTAGTVKHKWNFDGDGILRLPTGGDIVDSTGTSVLGGANLGDLQVAETEGVFNRITGTALGTGIMLDVEESAADVLGGNIFLRYGRHPGSVDTNTGNSHFAVTPYGVEVSTNNSSWEFKHNGSVAFNNSEVHIATNNWGITAPVEASTVVYTQKSNGNLASIRVHATIEGVEDGDTTGNHTQACDMMIVRRVSNGGISTVDSVVYGVIYTGTGPLATLDAQWNATTSKIEITAIPVSTTNNVYVKIYATEVARGD